MRLLQTPFDRHGFWCGSESIGVERADDGLEQREAHNLPMFPLCHQSQRGPFYLCPAYVNSLNFVLSNANTTLDITFNGFNCRKFYWSIHKLKIFFRTWSSLKKTSWWLTAKGFWCRAVVRKMYLYSYHPSFHFMFLLYKQFRAI